MYVQIRMVIREFLGSPDPCNEGEVCNMYIDNRAFVTTGVEFPLDTAMFSGFCNKPHLQVDR
jgi:hypothetical protein